MYRGFQHLLYSMAMEIYVAPSVVFLVVLDGGCCWAVAVIGVGSRGDDRRIYAHVKPLVWLHQQLPFLFLAYCRNGGQRSEAASLAARRGSRAAGLEFCVEVVRFCASPQRSCRCC
ncbi:unnamed protein product [Microthlaspi erraticum]|uniref:Uncharacterized protein n=1 Tax=Microthlaspi erraticum TaxID=1685480 RepID=A0A6D2LI74_9BRAS|nr:unnamed protein product [Microthlaspi erraticum]